MGGELCRWQHGSNVTNPYSGRCVPTYCDELTNATECMAHSEGEISCAWINSSTTSSGIYQSRSSSEHDESLSLLNGHCISYDGNCSVLPSESSCNAMDDCEALAYVHYRRCLTGQNANMMTN